MSNLIEVLRATVLSLYAQRRFDRGQTSTTIGPSAQNALLQTTDRDAVQAAFKLIDPDIATADWRSESVVITQANQAETADVGAVLDAWRAATNNQRRKNTPARIRLIKARLRDGYTRDEMIAAVKAFGDSDFHAGNNDRGIPYNDVKHFAGSAEKLDAWIDAAKLTRNTGETARMDRAMRDTLRRRRR